MLDDPLDYTGEQGKTVDPKTLNFIDIGLLAPTDPGDRAGNDVYRGAFLAVEEANKTGGLRGVPFRLVRRWAVDTWAAGSKEMIKLVYLDKTWAVICFRSATSHIASQIATKSRVPVITPVSTDGSLTFARVPWVFRLPPDDKTEANVIIKKGLIANRWKKTGVFAGNTNDNRFSATAFQSEMKRNRISPVLNFKTKAGLPGLQNYITRIAVSGCDSLVVFLDNPDLSTLLSALRKNRIKCPVLLPWLPGVNITQLRKIYGHPVSMVQPFDIKSISNIFYTQYKTKFNASPTHSAAYAYDAARLIIRAIRAGDLNRAHIRKAIADTIDYRGASGPVKWDSGGGNRGGIGMTLSEERKKSGLKTATW